MSGKRRKKEEEKEENFNQISFKETGERRERKIGPACLGCVLCVVQNESKFALPLLITHLNIPSCFR